MPQDHQHHHHHLLYLIELVDYLALPVNLKLRLLDCILGKLDQYLMDIRHQHLDQRLLEVVQDCKLVVMLGCKLVVTLGCMLVVHLGHCN